MVTVFEQTDNVIDLISNILTIRANRKAVSGVADKDLAESFDILFNDKVAKDPTKWEKFKNGWNNFKDKYGEGFKKVFKVVAMGGIAGYFLYQVIGSQGHDVAADIGFTLYITGFLIHGIEKTVQGIMTTRLGNWLSHRVSKIQTTVMKDLLEGFRNWFTKKGIAPNSVFAKMFGANSAEFFCKKIRSCSFALCHWTIRL